MEYVLNGEELKAIVADYVHKRVGGKKKPVHIVFKIYAGELIGEKNELTARIIY